MNTRRGPCGDVSGVLTAQKRATPRRRRNRILVMTVRGRLYRGFCVRGSCLRGSRDEDLQGSRDADLADLFRLNGGADLADLFTGRGPSTKLICKVPAGRCPRSVGRGPSRIKIYPRPVNQKQSASSASREPKGDPRGRRPV